MRQNMISLMLIPILTMFIIIILVLIIDYYCSGNQKTPRTQRQTGLPFRTPDMPTTTATTGTTATPVVSSSGTYIPLGSASKRSHVDTSHLDQFLTLDKTQVILMFKDTETQPVQILVEQQQALMNTKIMPWLSSNTNTIQLIQFVYINPLLINLLLEVLSQQSFVSLTTLHCEPKRGQGITNLDNLGNAIQKGHVPILQNVFLPFNEFLQNAFSLQGLESLQVLNLHATNISNVIFINQKFSMLKDLDLSNTDMKEETLSSMIQRIKDDLEILPQLQTWNLLNTSILDRSMVWKDLEHELQVNPRFLPNIQKIVCSPKEIQYELDVIIKFRSIIQDWRNLAESDSCKMYLVNRDRSEYIRIFDNQETRDMYTQKLEYIQTLDPEGKYFGERFVEVQDNGHHIIIVSMKGTSLDQLLRTKGVSQLQRNQLSRELFINIVKGIEILWTNQTMHGNIKLNTMYYDESEGKATLKLTKYEYLQNVQKGGEMENRFQFNIPPEIWNTSTHTIGDRKKFGKPVTLSSRTAVQQQNYNVIQDIVQILQKAQVLPELRIMGNAVYIILSEASITDLSTYSETIQQMEWIQHFIQSRNQVGGLSLLDKILEFDMYGIGQVIAQLFNVEDTREDWEGVWKGICQGTLDPRNSERLDVPSVLSRLELFTRGVPAATSTGKEEEVEEESST